MATESTPRLFKEPEWELLSTDHGASHNNNPNFFLADDKSRTILRTWVVRNRPAGASTNPCKHTSTPILAGKVYFGRQTEGPPGNVHGGCICAILDHVMGRTGWEFGKPCLVGTLNVKMMSSVPLCSTAVIEAWVESIEGRKIKTQARLYCCMDAQKPQDWTLAAVGSCTNVTVPKEHWERLRSRLSKL